LQRFSLSSKLIKCLRRITSIFLPMTITEIIRLERLDSKIGICGYVWLQIIM
jgi:hypothetical protein